MRNLFLLSVLILLVNCEDELKNGKYSSDQVRDGHKYHHIVVEKGKSASSREGRLVHEHHDWFTSSRGKGCYRLVRTRTRIAQEFVQKSLRTTDRAECEYECAQVTRFTCRGFNFRYKGQSGNGHNCELSLQDTYGTDLDDRRTFYVDSDFDFYERTKLGRDCDGRPLPNIPNELNKIPTTPSTPTTSRAPNTRLSNQNLRDSWTQQTKPGWSTPSPVPQPGKWPSADFNGISSHDGITTENNSPAGQTVTNINTHINEITQQRQHPFISKPVMQGSSSNSLLGDEAANKPGPSLTATIDATAIINTNVNTDSSNPVTANNQLITSNTNTISSNSAILTPGSASSTFNANSNTIITRQPIIRNRKPETNNNFGSSSTHRQPFNRNNNIGSRRTNVRNNRFPTGSNIAPPPKITFHRIKPDQDDRNALKNRNQHFIINSHEISNNRNNEQSNRNPQLFVSPTRQRPNNNNQFDSQVFHRITDAPLTTPRTPSNLFNSNKINVGQSNNRGNNKHYWVTPDKYHDNDNVDKYAWVTNDDVSPSGTDKFSPLIANTNLNNNNNRADGNRVSFNRVTNTNFNNINNDRTSVGFNGVSSTNFNRDNDRISNTFNRISTKKDDNKIEDNDDGNDYFASFFNAFNTTIGSTNNVNDNNVNINGNNYNTNFDSVDTLSNTNNVNKNRFPVSTRPNVEFKRVQSNSPLFDNRPCDDRTTPTPRPTFLPVNANFPNLSFNFPTRKNKTQQAKPNNLFNTNRPSNFNNRPSNFNNRPSNLNNRPSSFNNRPSNFNKRPSNFNKRPLNLNNRPLNLNNRPSNLNNRPLNLNNRPSNLNNRPSNLNNRPNQPSRPSRPTRPSRPFRPNRPRPTPPPTFAIPTTSRPRPFGSVNAVTSRPTNQVTNRPFKFRPIRPVTTVRPVTSRPIRPITFRPNRPSSSRPFSGSISFSFTTPSSLNNNAQYSPVYSSFHTTPKPSSEYLPPITDIISSNNINAIDSYKPISSDGSSLKNNSLTNNINSNHQQQFGLNDYFNNHINNHFGSGNTANKFGDNNVARNPIRPSTTTHGSSLSSFGNTVANIGIGSGSFGIGINHQGSNAGSGGNYGSRPFSSGGNRPFTDNRRPFGGSRPIIEVNRPLISGDRPTTGGNRRPISGNRPTIDFNRPSIGANRPTSGSNRRPIGGKRPTIGINRPTAGGNSFQNSMTNNFGTSSSISGSQASFFRAECFRLGRGDSRLSLGVVRRRLKVYDLKECKQSCFEMKTFSCKSAAFKYRGNTWHGGENCYLSDRDMTELNSFDVLTDPNYDIFQRNIRARECSGAFGGGSDSSVSSTPIDLDAGRETVSGLLCYGNSRCREDTIGGYWYCDTNAYGAWDYCCRPDQVCSTSSGNHLKWCYVGSLGLDQWRPCNNGFSRDFLLDESPRNVTSNGRNSTASGNKGAGVGGDGSSVLASLSALSKKYPHSNNSIYVKTKNPSFIGGNPSSGSDSSSNINSPLTRSSSTRGELKKDQFHVELNKLYPGSTGPKLGDNS